MAAAYNLVYDGSFDGFLSCVFEIYRLKLTDVSITRSADFQVSLFGSEIEVDTDCKKADRVWKGLKKKLTARGRSRLYYAFCSENAQVEEFMLRYIQYAFGSKDPIDSDFSNPDVLRIAQLAKSVGREKHRMEAFVRFRLTKDDIYFATIAPDFNVLPLIVKHFKSRYADQSWIIYDLHRQFGIYYNLKEIQTVTYEFPSDFDPLKTTDEFFGSAEMEFQTLWQDYFKSTNIAARKNLKLHIRHIPKRYWKYLSEKRVE